MSEIPTPSASTNFIDLAYKGNGAQLSLGTEAIKQKENALAALEQITAVTNPNDLAVATNLVAIAAGLEKKMEATRASVKKPVLDLGKLIDQTAKDYIGSVTSAKDRVLKLINDFNTAESARQEKARKEAEAIEAKRLADIEAARKKEEAEKAEQERLRQEEVDRLNRETAEKLEQARIGALPKSPDEDPALVALRKAGAEEEAAEIERNRSAAELALKDSHEADRLKEDTARLAAESARTMVVSAPLTPSVVRPKGMSAQKVWKYSVEDPLAFYKAHPELCKIELIPSAINQAIKDGLRESPGITIFEENVTRIRAAA